MRDNRPARRRTCMKRSLTVTQVPEPTTERAATAREAQQGAKQKASTTDAAPPSVQTSSAKFSAKLPTVGQMTQNSRKRSRSPSCVPPDVESSSPEPDDPVLSRRSSAASGYIPTPPTSKFVSDRAATPKAPMMRQPPFDESSQQLPFGQFPQQLSFGQYTMAQPQAFDYDSSQYLYSSPPFHPQGPADQTQITRGPTHSGGYPYLHLEEFGMVSQQFVPHIPESHHQIWPGLLHSDPAGLSQGTVPSQFGMAPFQHTGTPPPEASLVSPTDQAPAFYRVDESRGTAKAISTKKGTRRRLDGGKSTQSTAPAPGPPLVFDLSIPDTFYTGDPAVAGVIHDTMREHGFCK